VTLPAVLDDVAREPRRFALVCDFDGTLAPIVDDPAEARALPEALAALRALVPRLAVVGIVSGRPIAFLRERVPVEGVALVGQYGLERLEGGEVRVDPRVAEHVADVAAGAEEAARMWPSLRVERKGDIAFTVHWRTVPDDEPEYEALWALGRRHGLELLPGKLACELRPPVPLDKGRALELLVGADIPNVAFAGDDRGDLAAFAALEHRASAPGATRARVIKIAVGSDEAPAQLLERADVVVDGPAGFAQMLSDLAAAVRNGSRAVNDPPRP
jgi:trehalose 6-phosphate phosphatase